MNWYKLEGWHSNQTGIIIGNGPSLKDVPLEFLKKYPSFGTNRIYLMDGFSPTYYVCVNPLVAEQSIEQIKALSCPKFITDKWAYKVDGIPLISNYQPHFSLNPQAYIYEGYTVSFVCMQIAHWMDFDTILLVGVDHRYTFDGAPNQEKVADGIDHNHFHPAYFSGGTRWNNPDLQRSEDAYRMAKKAFENYGKRIINLTDGSALDVFEKDEVKNW